MVNFLSNPFTSVLKDIEYNYVMFPRASIKPLQLVAIEDKKLHSLGKLSSIFEKPNPYSSPYLPPIYRNSQAVNVVIDRHYGFDPSVLVSILCNVISGWGGGTLGLSAQFQRGNSISCQYEGVIEDGVALLKLDEYLKAAEWRWASITQRMEHLLRSNNIGVITSVIKSKKFTVFPKKYGQFKLEPSLIQNIVGTKVAVSSKSDESSAITFEGSIPLVFGIRAVKLLYDKCCVYSGNKFIERKKPFMIDR